MSPDLDGTRIAILATDGVAQTELAYLADRFRLEAATVSLVSTQPGRIWTTLDDLTPGHDITVTCTIEDLVVKDLSALVLPSGIVSASRLRVDANVIALISDYLALGRPLGVRGDGIALLIEAQGVRHRRLSTLPRWRTDVRNAGGLPVSDPIVTEDSVISSAGPGNLGIFWTTLLEQLRPPSVTRSPRHDPG